MLIPNPVQSTYQRFLTVAQLGMPATTTGWDVDTRIVETSAGISFGLAVSQGTGDNGCILGGTAFVGITKADPTLAQASSITTVDKYLQYDNAAIFVRGDIWVIAEDTVTAGEAVYYSTTFGTLGHSGGTVIEDARWMTSATGGNLAVVRLGNSAGNR
jgi:hypothetical protein